MFSQKTASFYTEQCIYLRCHLHTKHNHYAYRYLNCTLTILTKLGWLGLLNSPSLAFWPCTCSVFITSLQWKLPVQEAKALTHLVDLGHVNTKQKVLRLLSLVKHIGTSLDLTRGGGGACCLMKSASKPKWVPKLYSCPHKSASVIARQSTSNWQVMKDVPPTHPASCLFKQSHSRVCDSYIFLYFCTPRRPP